MKNAEGIASDSENEVAICYRSMKIKRGQPLGEIRQIGNLTEGAKRANPQRRRLYDPDNLPYVLHIDGDRTNNHYTNLEWSARQSNHPMVIEH